MLFCEQQKAQKEKNKREGINIKQFVKKKKKDKTVFFLNPRVVLSSRRSLDCAYDHN